MKHPKNIPWVARDTGIRFCAGFLRSVPGGGGASKTQIVYNSNMNFHTVVPYLELLVRNGLAERTEGEVLRYRTTAKGEEALQHFRELEETTLRRMLQLLKGWLNYIDLPSSQSANYRKRVQIQNVLIH
jgi:predicted transcriptional regulator